MKRLSGFKKFELYVRSLLSRYLHLFEKRYGVIARASQQTKAIRKISCHGDGETLDPCPERIPSQRFTDSYICNACGCGDYKRTLLSGQTPQYEKLDYPFLFCPLNMPGFSTYEFSETEHPVNERKQILEERFGKEYLIDLTAKQQRFKMPQHFFDRFKQLVAGSRSRN